MATIKTIIDELNTVATAFSSVKTFIFDEIAAINDTVDKTYPVILVDSRDVNFTDINYNNVFLPKNKSFTLRLFLFDTFFDDIDKQTKYASLMTIGDQFLAEVKKRAVNNYQGVSFKSGNNGFEVDKLHNDSLVQIVYNLTFTVENECTEGVFAY